MNDLDKPRHFIQQIIDEDLSQQKNQGRVHTRFPPEPNGYLHIGHAKAICLNFGLALEYDGGVCNLRFDDTNPEKETQEYVDAIKADVTWLGFAWQDQLFHSSDYFQRLYDIAETMVLNGDAYVCSLSADETRAYRGGLTAAGKNSPYRDRSVDENIDLFRRMRAGEFPDGAHVLRAKIDMASPNMNMRDPTLYRIRHVDHQRTGDSWRIYPMYDFTHSLSDAIEGVTHSLCSLEFADHRPLYDWMVKKAGLNSIPAQYEFSRLELQYTITSKRKLNQLVIESYVSGWDDPRMPTVSGMRRRGYTAASIREFCARIGVTKSNNSIEMASLESCLREDLDKIAPRAMGVLRPLKIVLQNYDADKVEEITAANHPQQEQMGKRTLFFTRELYIDRDDFREEANRKYKRLVNGGEVRLRNAYVIKCEQVIKDDNGEIVELLCSCDLDTLGKKPEGRKVKGVIHWVSAQQSEDAEIRLYDRLFTVPHPDADSEKPFVDFINPDSLQVIQHARVEKSLSNAEIGQPYQFEREGYFCLDSDSSDKKMVFNRTVTLRDSWAKIEQK